ncbi:prephenate dehydratase [Larsenimonas rhizosphaerae]|uniref:Bifunctional chorismate mutase/prephenate dehydratase n=1 Tax=Larsenimonas rhizosphaerae TaxID=2944682 RepID=A0AA41ZGZ5_9GAMM|nr:prephenate dehydratase [Larsenimonas rhizosphaerae]MCM2131008.1 prephenate dehydratase [Larsenimonas rhizosphaerae]MCX2523713.1 prephenate dehydratase [Larsenimonas rhizosphaerae]
MSDHMPSQDSETLDTLRQRIDRLDQDILNLISERARCAQDVANVKLAENPDAIFYRPEREAGVLRRIMELNQGPLSNEEMARLFREIMSSCLALEQPVRVAYLGPEGTFTEQAALKHFGGSAVHVSTNAIDEVFREVEAGATHYGVVPVENSTEGIVSHTLDSFMAASPSLKINGEVVLRIHQHLLVSERTRRDQISRIYSHSQSLAQCRKWLDAHYPHAERIAVSSNAEAARLVKSEWHSAAIAGDMAAKRYGLERVAEKIEDQPDNSTRFLIIGTHDVPPSGDDKTSIVAAMRNKPGVLHDLLEPFQRHGIDMTRLESRPSRNGAWSYVFFIDFKGHQNDEKVRAALDEAQACAAELKVLGSYPVGVL